MGGRAHRTLSSAARRDPLDPYAVEVVHGGGESPVSYWKDGEHRRIGTDVEVAWIKESTKPGLTIASAIPPVFAAYATAVVPDKDEGRSEHLGLILRLLTEQSPDQPWWLGYLDTGADDLVFPDAPRVTLYAGWPYVLVQAGPAEAARWRHDLRSWRAPGPDLIFPADRSWLLSWLWDDDWRCLGGPGRARRSVFGPSAITGTQGQTRRRRHTTGSRSALTVRPELLDTGCRP
jgi:hypothetical protein